MKATAQAHRIFLQVRRAQKAPLLPPAAGVEQAAQVEVLLPAWHQTTPQWLIWVLRPWVLLLWVPELAVVVAQEAVALQPAPLPVAQPAPQVFQEQEAFLPVAVKVVK